MKRAVILAAILLATLCSLVLPIPAMADGGPVVDPDLFARLKEGQQVAVVTVRDDGTASVDLFISILDQTGESHEITFFIPLGTRAEYFAVDETDSLAFNENYTRQLDMAVFQAYRQNRALLQCLFAGALLTNGVWLTPLWLPFLLSGCGEAPAPVSTYTTDSSQVSIFGLDESTDIEALISTTGLDPSVSETLTRFKGQQIAVVNLRTTPQAPAAGIESSGEVVAPGEPGLRLSWRTPLSETGAGAAYAYPLGTGSAWAQPIEMTRVYVVVPEGLDMTVDFPKLGADRSGYVRKTWSFEPRIIDSTGEKAYAVERATGVSRYPYTGQFDIWRVTYTNSNAAEDVVISVSPSSGIDPGAVLREAGSGPALLAGLVIAVIFWLLAWYFLMPRLLGRDRRSGGLWRLSLTYVGLNLLLFVPGTVLFFFFSFSGSGFALLLAAVLFGGASVLTFALRHLDRLGVSPGRAIRAFALVTLASNGAYLLFVWGYAALVGAI